MTTTADRHSTTRINLYRIGGREPSRSKRNRAYDLIIDLGIRWGQNLARLSDDQIASVVEAVRIEEQSARAWRAWLLASYLLTDRMDDTNRNLLAHARRDHREAIVLLRRVEEEAAGRLAALEGRIRDAQRTARALRRVVR